MQATSNMISTEEIARRKPVWIALSEFYLDTTLDDKDFQHIAKILKESGYSLNEIKRIHYEEVAPVVSPNLMSPAGIWSGFEGDWLEKKILKNIASKTSRPILNKIFKMYIDRMTNRYWRPIEKIINVG
jgi:hypothetical protein